MRRLDAFPGIIFQFHAQPAEDAVDEAETGLKSSLAVKIFGADLKVLEDKGKAIKKVVEKVRGIKEVTLVQELGQPSLAVTVDRAKIARYGLNVADINGLIQAAVGGTAATQVVQGEKQFDLVVRVAEQYRGTPEQIGNILVATPNGQQIPLREFADIKVDNGASFIYRDANSRYIGVQFSVEGRDLAGAVNDAQAQVKAAVSLPEGYFLDWGGEYTEYTASRSQLRIILPLTLCLIFLLLFALYSNLKFPFITVLGVIMSAPVGGIVALWLTHTPFSVSVRGFDFWRCSAFSGADGSRLHFLCQRTPAQRRQHHRICSRRSDTPTAPDHDDRAGGGTGVVAGGGGDGRRHRFAKAVRAGDRERPFHAAVDQYFPDARAVCARGAAE